MISLTDYIWCIIYNPKLPYDQDIYYNTMTQKLEVEYFEPLYNLILFCFGCQI